MKIFPAHYFPPIPWFVAAMQASEVRIEQWQHYRKQRYSSRMCISAANGPLNLVVPVERRGAKVPICEKRISYREKWQRQHWNSLLSAYRNAPFFEYYQPELEAIILHKHEKLIDLLKASWDWCWEKLRLESAYTLTDTYAEIEPEADLREVLEAKPGEFPALYKILPYSQVFGRWDEDVSVLDLLVNLGPESRAQLSKPPNPTVG